jgi:deazaflavin-dependent oxidoreductase (nitroreductase family)
VTGYRRLAQLLGHQPAFAVMLRAVGARVDRRLHRVSAPPTLLLTTLGRHTGRLRTTPLIYHRDGDRLVVSPEHFGEARPAAWPANLDACPYACVRVGAAIRAVRARPATPDEAERYRGSMYVLEPLGDPAS